MIGKRFLDPVTRRQIAESSPARLLRLPSFWRAQPMLIVAGAGGFAAIVLLAPHTYHTTDVWVLLTIGIQSLGGWGWVATARSLARLEVETALAMEAESRGVRYLSEIKSQRIPRIELGKLERELGLTNPTKPEPAMIRLLSHICKEARDRKFESSVNLVEPYKEEALEDIFMLQNIQKIALWLGILGTFIGLLLAIDTSSLRAAKQDSDLVNVVGQMFGSLSISFSASLAGLEVAVLLGCFLMLLRKRHEGYFQCMEGAAVTMLSLARNSINTDDFLSEFSQISASMRQMSDQFYDRATELASSVNSVEHRIKDQTHQIQTGIDNLAKASAQFDGFLNNLAAEQRQFIDDIKRVYDTISLRHLDTTFKQAVDEAGKRIGGAADASVQRLSSQLLLFNNSVQTLSGTLDSGCSDLSESTRALAHQLGEQAAQNSVSMKAARAIVESLTQYAKANEVIAMQSNLRELSHSIDALAASLKARTATAAILEASLSLVESLAAAWAAALRRCIQGASNLWRRISRERP